MSSILSNIAVVLFHPEHGGNIGAVARGMKNFGLSDLRIVGDFDPQENEARKMAVSAGPLLDSARRYETLLEAVEEMTWVVGTSPRSGRAWRAEPIREVAQSLLAKAQAGPVALVFGPERTGLDNVTLARCQQVAAIPTAPEFSSLNLAQAAILCFYELFTQAAQPPPPHRGQLAPYGLLEELFQHVEKTLLNVEFLLKEQPELVMSELRRIFYRAELTVREAKMLRGVFTNIGVNAERTRVLWRERVEGQPSSLTCFSNQLGI